MFLQIARAVILVLACGRCLYSETHCEADGGLDLEVDFRF